MWGLEEHSEGLDFMLNRKILDDFEMWHDLIFILKDNLGQDLVTIWKLDSRE